MTATPITFPPTLWGLVEQRAATAPDEVLLADESNRELTGRGLADAAEELAAWLAERGVGTDSRVSWQLPTQLEAVTLMVALARLGAVQNPIIPILREREVDVIVTQSRADVLITPTVWRGFDYHAMATDIAGRAGCDTVTLDRGDRCPGRPELLPPPPAPAPGTTRFVYYTSGTTAEPKGARHTDASVMAAANGIVTLMGASAADRVPIAFPFTHIGGVSFLTASLYTGAQAILFEHFDPASTPEEMARFRPTLLGSAVPFFRAYLEAQRRAGDQPLYPEIRAFINGGAPKPPELHYELQRVFGVGILSGWGLTEFPIATASAVDDLDEDLAHSEGLAAPGVEVRAVGADGADLGPGAEGELRVRGPQAMLGYVDAHLDADAVDDQGFCRTGDLGVIGPRGHVRITGRLKDVVIRNAENISVQEVEELLHEHPSIVEAAVVGLPDERTGERACAVIVQRPGTAPLTLTDIGQWCRDHGIARQKIPEQLDWVEELPRNSMGKILKQEIRQRLLPR